MRLELLTMSTLREIEAAIEQLPEHQVDELCSWLRELRGRQISPVSVEQWLQRARGVGGPGVTTEQVLAVTRGEE